MDNTLTECAAVDETVVFLNYFKDLHDPRQQGKVCYPLEEILLLCLLAVVAGAETITEIAIFGARKLDLLRRFRSFRDGTPTHDHLGDILAVLDAGQFQSCFAAWVASITGIPEGVIAIDGKTSRRSGLKNKGKAAIHMVSAFAARQRLVLGQVKVTEKSNEITALRRRGWRQGVAADGLWVDRRHRLGLPHQPRRRRDCLGELVQIDGSEHAWFETRGETCTPREALRALGLPLLATRIVERKVYRRALTQGQAVGEFEPGSKAAREIKKLWKEVNGLDAAKIKTATAALAHEEAA
jgi:hypothetical protein